MLALCRVMLAIVDYRAIQQSRSVLALCRVMLAIVGYRAIQQPRPVLASYRIEIGYEGASFLCEIHYSSQRKIKVVVQSHTLKHNQKLNNA